MSDKDVVADNTQVDPQDTTDDTGAQTDDLDTLLNEIDSDFDKGTQVAPETDKDPELSAKVDYLLKQQENTAIAEAVSSVQGGLKELEVSAPDEAIEGMLNQMAIKDPRFMKAFQERDQNPGQWNKVLGAATKSIGKKFGDMVDKSLTDDRDSVANAIRGSSTTSEEDAPKNYNSMSDSDFEAEKLKY